MQNMKLIELEQTPFSALGDTGSKYQCSTAYLSILSLSKF